MTYRERLDAEIKLRRAQAQATVQRYEFQPKDDHVRVLQAGQHVGDVFLDHSDDDGCLPSEVVQAAIDALKAREQ